jgi:transcriptional regulator with XRE-family HTH domain
MKTDLLNKEYREAFVEENIKTGIAFQIRALRNREGWSQGVLGQKAGKPQNVISRLEDPDYGNFTIRTLLDLASAFDVAILVRFVSFDQLMNSLKNVSQEALAVPSFKAEQEIQQQQKEKITRETKVFDALLQAFGGGNKQILKLGLIGERHENPWDFQSSMQESTLYGDPHRAAQRQVGTCQ